MVENRKQNTTFYPLSSIVNKNPMDEIARIRERTDLVSFISEYISLKKMGRNFKAICPFHQEKTPSFIVSPERQIWHCFGGCGKGGDVFTFLMEYENLEFVEALRILAKRAGVELRESGFERGISSKKERIYILNKIAMDFYHFVLTKHKAGEEALKYLIDIRKIDSKLIETFMIGLSPKDGTSLSNYLIQKKKFKKEDLIEAGLAFYRGLSTGQVRVLDFFRNRIMFPLLDQRGNVVGFSGRAIEESLSSGKYINTRDTIVYHKGSMFFGLNIAKDEIKKMDKAIIMEGEFDVISSYGIGVKNVIAVKGTALTDNQASLISRFTDNVCLCFDQDDAGYEATKRSLSSLEKKGLNITVAEVKNGKDADEAIKNDPISFKKSIKQDVAVYDYLLSRILSIYDKDTIDGKRKISVNFLPIISRIGNEIVKEHYLRKLSTKLDISLDALVKEMEKIEKKEAINIKENIVSVKKQSLTRREVLEEYLTSLVIQYENPKIVLEKANHTLSNYEFETLSYGKVLNHLLIFLKKSPVFNSRNFLETLPKELLATYDTCFLYPLPKFSDTKHSEMEAVKIATELRVLFLKDKIKEISSNLRSREKEEDIKKIEVLEKELSSIINLLSEG
ncbi:MAG: DNA primase [Candidatus Levybacteria bacterium]|nr:DNA primase [Candidatus Levybacteria bacterium]